ncbi:unnamed protein product [Ilex paraguariensis]|uniref:Replication factor A C-terminal domain-containing protein n=1 Tax=Ilex paraguariensis TaxID=185542 RepID=A0ABC8S214_9AQUA
MILEIENKDEPWYDACNQCRSRFFNDGEGAECKKCKKSNVEHTLRCFVESNTMHDEGTVELWNLSNNFIVLDNEIGKNMPLGSVQELKQLKNAIVISTFTRVGTRTTFNN